MRYALGQPLVGYALLGLGSVGMLLGLYQPGSLVTGVIGAVSLLLAFFGLASRPMNLAGTFMFILGFLLLGLENFVHSGGTLTVCGVIALVVGSVEFIDWPFLPARQPSSSSDGLIRSRGVARTFVGTERPGLVLVQGELWQAVADRAPVEPGRAVQVDRVAGLQLTVHALPVPIAEPSPREVVRL